MINVLYSSIRGRYRLPCIDKSFRIREKVGKSQVTKARLFPCDDTTFGIKLDNSSSRPFHFFSDAPSPGLLKMCDGIFIHVKDENIFFVLIEIKTSHPDGSEDQLMNGKLFCQWLVALLRRYNFAPSGQVRYFAVLMWEPSNIPKATTVPGKPKAIEHPVFDKYFDIQHTRDIDVNDLIAASIQHC